MENSPAGTRCPTCIGQLLVSVGTGGAEILVCEKCGNIWCSAAAFIANEIGLSVELRAEGRASMHCPSCRKEMNSLRIVGVDAVAPLRQCTACHGFWVSRPAWARMRALSDSHASRRDAARSQQGTRFDPDLFDLDPTPDDWS